MVVKSLGSHMASLGPHPSPSPPTGSVSSVPPLSHLWHADTNRTYLPGHSEGERR